MQAPPSMAAEVRKLAMVSATNGSERPADRSTACSTIANSPAITASARITGLILVSIRPTVAQ